MINLRPPTRTDAQLRAIAASGSRGLVLKARAELQARQHERLRAATGMRGEHGRAGKVA